MFNRIKIGSAWRSARNLAGGLTGFIYCLSNIFTVPIKGKFPASFVSAVGMIAFMLELQENYRLAAPVKTLKDYKNEKIQSCTKAIATALLQDPNQLRQFLEADKEQKSEVPLAFSSEYVDELLTNAFNESLQHTHWRNSFHNYFHSTAAFLIQVGSHFGECMLAKTYDKSDLYKFKEFSADNIFMVLLAFVALYHGYQRYQETQDTYKKSLVDAACDKLTKSYIKS